MIIRNFFEKDINRSIETVIKADNTDNIANEVVEYVVTKEISKKIRDFFQAYTDFSVANGVWISGFFGCGKSHLLKILSYVLENKEFDGYYCGEIFAEKIDNDEMLKGDVLAATRIPSESILFNIDQQAQITSKSDESAILSVFYKVFYDHLGYYGFQPHVAEFEMWLDKTKKYAAFKEIFQEKLGKPWTEARLDYFDPQVASAISDSLGVIYMDDASKYQQIMDVIEDKHKQSIEDFCLRVHNYIKTKSSGFRLNFFVDEVGQYISENTKLMLNLQTIAETLATKTKGASWIIVTSQEDMEKVVGDMNKKQLNDFSRIQARFELKIPLTSANVDEVIEKRLLKKKDEIQTQLSKTFKKESAHLESILSFSEAGVQFRGYSNETDYANKFPFVAYQFDLFQQCRRALSTHNAFQGKHASVGERSMLGVFQQVIQSIEQRDENAMVSFDLMYEGLRNELRGEIQSSITLAERQLDNRFAIKVLKALFLVKYYSNFKTTKRNISVLMIDNKGVDLKEHENKITEALSVLENQSYIQRNGDLYEYLTDAEKDIEEEIKATDIDDTSVTELLKSLLFDEIIKENKIVFIENKQYYDFTSKIDGVTLGREKELEIEIITENYHNYEQETFIQAQTMGSQGMKMVLPPNAFFMKDVRVYLKTDKYYKQNQSTSNKTENKRILQEKAQLNAKRRRDLIALANTALAQSTVYIGGTKQELNGTSDGKTKVINAFQVLIKTVYSNIGMIGNTQYTEDTIKTVIRSKQDDLFGTDEKTMGEAESEILNIIVRRKKQAERTTLNDIKNHFIKKTYGWYPNAIWTLVAMLFKRGKIEVKQDSNSLEDESVLNAILNTSFHSNTLLETQASYDIQAINNLKKVYTEAFDESCGLREAKDIAVAFKEKLKGMDIEVNQLLAKKREYPFLSVLDDFADKLGRWVNKDYSHYLTSIKDFEDDLLDAKEDILSPLKRFMSGDQIKIYDNIKTMLSGDLSNMDYIEGFEYTVLNDLMQHPKPYSGNLIKEAKSAMDTLANKLNELIKKERENAVQSIEKAIETLQNKEEFKKIDANQQNSIILPLTDELNRVKGQKYIAVIRDIKRKVHDIILEKQLNAMMRYSMPEQKEMESVMEDTYVRKDNVKPKFSKSELRTEQDVDDYIEMLRKAYKEEIQKKRRIVL